MIRHLLQLSLLCILFPLSLYGDPFYRVPLPKLHEPVQLKVVYADNPRFRSLSEEEIRRMLSYTKEAARKHLDVTVEFTLAPAITVDALFDYLKPSVKKSRKNEIYDLKGGDGNRTRLYKAFMKAMDERYTPLENLIAYAAPYLVNPPAEQTESAFASALTDTLLHRVKTWQTLEAPDGKPVIDGSDYNEWVYWDSLGYGALPYDIVITNTLVASVEYYGQDLHSALRGGVTVGTTTNNNSKLGAYIFWTTFPFTETYPLLKEMRDGDYRPEDALRLSGIYLAHEIGHLLFHYGHPFECDACIMNPVPMLHFKNWERRLDPNKCRRGNYPAMKKGAATIYYNPEWYANPDTAVP